jgi:two-component system LytT family response regulator
MKTEMIRTIVVDDEPMAREGMAMMLREVPGIEVVAICRNGIEAIQDIREKRPDLLMLDIQMPGIDGFDVLNNLTPAERPLTVFVTAYDQYAVKAFEYHALDYLLKPYTDERFFEMIERVKELIHQQKQADQLEKMDLLSNQLLQKRKNLTEIYVEEEGKGMITHQDKLIVKEGGKIHLLPMSEIQYIEAYDYYVKIHQTGSFVLARIPIKKMAEQLPSRIFIRIHRSYILNMLFLKQIVKNDSGKYHVMLGDDCQLKVGNTFKMNLLNRMKFK